MNDILRSLFYSFLLVILFSLVAYVWLSPDFAKRIGSAMDFKWATPGLDLQKFNETPEKYLDAEVTVTGKLSLYSNKYNSCPVSVNRLTDKKGYQMRICSITQELQEGETYSLKGKIVKDTSNSTGVEYYVLKVE